jgi:hypothetical protein
MRIVRNVIIICGGTLTAIITILLAVMLISVLFRQEIAKNPELINTFSFIIKERLPAVIGLPIAALFSLFLVSIFRITTGPIEFESPYVKIKGAAGPVIFWLICFLTITICIKLLW